MKITQSKQTKTFKDLKPGTVFYFSTCKGHLYMRLEGQCNHDWNCVSLFDNKLYKGQDDDTPVCEVNCELAVEY